MERSENNKGMDYCIRYYFALNPLNTQQDGKIYNSEKPMMEWDGKWFSSVCKEDTSWSCEVEIPYYNFTFDPKRDTLWRFNFLYISQTERQDVEICAFNPIEEGRGLLNLRSTSHFIIHASKGKTLPYTLFPYVALFKDTFYTFSLGADASIKKDDDLLFFTLNPEYASIETDVEQFNLERKKMIYLPEKRAFFMEGFELWKLPFEILYTRNLQDINYGLKFNGTYKNLKGNAFMISEKDTTGRFSFDFKNKCEGVRLKYETSLLSPGLFFIQRKTEKAYGIDALIYFPFNFSFNMQLTRAKGKDIYVLFDRVSGPSGYWLSSGIEILDEDFSFSVAYIPYEKNMFSIWFYNGYTKAYKRKQFFMLKIFYQKSTITGRTDFNFLFQYEFFAQSNVYFVYNLKKDKNEEKTLLMLKLAYQFNF